ncbi:MAG TPA: aldehyde dehydrogenase family protein [Peptococcaceae bacterium]|nr:aldehyde dehydrogenase family protein [Peptococcaceae bacterium]
MGKSQSMIKVDLFINNRDVRTATYQEIRDPGKLNDIVGKVAIGSAENVDQAIQAAHRAFFHWRETSIEERIKLLMTAAEILRESIQDLAPLLSREHGGLLKEAQSDFMAGYGNFQNYAGVVADFMKSEEKEDNTSWISIEKKPKGVVAAIVPWNMPVVLTMMKLVPALMTGNTIVVKPSPNAPLALTLLLKRMAAAVLPEGVVNVVHGDAKVGIALTRHPLVKKIAFTGGSITGKQVNINAAESLKGVTLELGGNDPAIILDDANLAEIMPRIVKGIFTRSGQICYAIKRIYVQEKIFDDFTDLLCQQVAQFKVGHGLDERSTLGPVNNFRQYQFVRELIEEAKSKGASIFELGSKLEPENWNNGYYILPHVVIDKEHNTRLVHSEQFGPVIPITPYKTVQQAIQLANCTSYGLASSVWSTDPERAKKIARQLEAGLSFINTHGLGSVVFGMPFGGIKDSGIGRESSPIPTLLAYTDYHAIRYLK